jgi:hypothetical protein
MPLGLGIDPYDLLIPLSPNGNFVQVIEQTDDAGAPLDWLVGEVLELLFPQTGDIWQAMLTGNEAEWNVPAADVATLLAALPVGNAEVSLLYTYGATGPLEWAKGQVIRR